jgi:hypothetical protein
MNVELMEDEQARRLQFMLAELGPAWTPAELYALLLDLSDRSHQTPPKVRAAGGAAPGQR